MKKGLFIAAIALTTITFAQENKNQVKETVTTKTNVTDNIGTKVYEKDVTKTQIEKVELNSTQANQTNQAATIKIMDVQVDETYSSNGSNFMFVEDRNGYQLKNMSNSAKSAQNGFIRPSSRKGNYILYMDNKSSMGYFDNNGSFIVENYDPKTDQVVATKYLLLETGGVKPMRDSSTMTDVSPDEMKETKKMNKRKNLKDNR